jgi:SH3-like domain-containing protein
MVMGKKIILYYVFFLLTALPALAQEARTAPDAQEAEAPAPASEADPSRSTSGLPIPRYVSLSSEKVFVRTGPALRYPVKWVYQRDSLPVEVIQEFDTWRKIRDIDGDTGWVHQSLLSGDRTAIVKGEANLALHREAGAEEAVIAYLEPNVVAFIKTCQKEWCEVTAQSYSGWAERKFLWGIYDTEDFD